MATARDCQSRQLYAAAVMRTRHFADTNTGLRRSRNEDAYLGDDQLGLFLVCDGVGGRARGEIASAEAAEVIWEWIKGEDALLSLAKAESVANTYDVELVANGSTGTTSRVTMFEDTIGRLGAMVRAAVQNASYTRRPPAALLGRTARLPRLAHHTRRPVQARRPRRSPGGDPPRECVRRRGQHHRPLRGVPRRVCGSPGQHAA